MGGKGKKSEPQKSKITVGDCAAEVWLHYMFHTDSYIKNEAVFDITDAVGLLVSQRFLFHFCFFGFVIKKRSASAITHSPFILEALIFPLVHQYCRVLSPRPDNLAASFKLNMVDL